MNHPFRRALTVLFVFGAIFLPHAARAADTVKPVVKISAPTANSTQPTLAITSGTSSDAGGVARVALLLYRYADAAKGISAGYFDGTLFTSKITGANYRNASTSDAFANWRATLPPLRAGKYALRAYAVDKAGLVGQSATLSFTLTQNAAITDDRRIAALGSLQTAINKMPKLDMATAHRAILGNILARPDFEAAGIAGSYNVWARFLDGRVLMVAIDTTTPAPSAKSSASRVEEPERAQLQNAVPVSLPQAAGTKRMNLPDSLKFHVLSGFGSYYEDSGLAHEEIKDALLRHGYVDGAAGSTEASVENLKVVLGDGVFYVNSHGNGAILRDGSKTFGLYTTTSVSTGADKAYRDDLDNERLCYMVETNGFLGSKGTHYGVLPEFVRKYWNFSPNSLVYINTCMSFADFAADFAIACYDKKAGCYVGWDNYSLVTAGAEAARYFFDRALGDNKFKPENPAQRAFDIVPVLADMDKKKLRFSDHPQFKAHLQFRPNDNGDKFGILAPSIKRMKVDELTDQITLTGVFGDNIGGKGEVSVDGRTLAIVSWEQEKVVATIPRSGVGSSGPVIASMGGRKSNIVPLTEWNGQIKYDLDGYQALEEKWMIPVRFRFDAHLSRDVPGEAPKAPTSQADTTFVFMRLNASGGSLDGTYEAKGRGDYKPGPDSCTEVLTWSGSQMLKNNGYFPTSAPNYVAVGFLDAQARKIKLFLTGTSVRHDVLYQMGPCDSTPIFNGDTGTTAVKDLMQPFWTLPVDEAWSIEPQEFGGQTTHPTAGDFPQATYTWQWDAMPATSPPPAAPYPDGYGS